MQRLNDTKCRHDFLSPLGPKKVDLTLLYSGTPLFTVSIFVTSRSKKHQNSAHGKLFFNPFDLGYKKNWQHVMGTSHFFISILPSNREPVGLPWPSLKVKVNRQGKSKNLDKKSVVHV